MTASLKNIRRTAATGLTALLLAGAVGAVSQASAQPNTSTPKASCTWDGKTTSDGGTHNEYVSTNKDGTKNYKQYKCNNGSWEYTGTVITQLTAGGRTRVVRVTAATAATAALARR